MSETIKTPAPTKSKPSKRTKPAKRRGAKVESEDEAEGAVATVPESDSDSDFAPPEPEDDSDSDGDDQVDPKTPAAASVEELGAKAVKPTLEGPPLPLSWADLPAPGEGGIDELPVLDFSNLSVAGITSAAPSSSVPKSPHPSTAPPKDPASKKSQLLAKRIAKSEEAKLKDPAAWEVAETARKAKELEKRALKKERVKEKRKELKAANALTGWEEQVEPVKKWVEQVETVKKALPTGPAPRLINAAFAPPRGAKTVVPSRPSKTSVALAAKAAPSAPTTTSPPLASADDAPSSRSAAAGPSNGHAVGPADNGDNSTPYFQAREAYTTRLAADPSYTPRIGKFWSHDERLMEPELRGLAPYWRGRGRGGEVRGARGGAVRGRGGMARGSGRHFSTGWGEPAEAEVPVAEPVHVAIKGIADNTAGAADGWGRGEEKRTTKNAFVQTPFASESPASSWTHDGYEELQAPRPPTGPRQPSNRRVADVGEPGTINPRYAHLPYHPSYRYPAAPLPVVSAPPVAVAESVRPPLPPKEPIVEPAPAVVRLPGSEATPVVGTLLPPPAPVPAPVEPSLPPVEEKREERIVAPQGVNPDRRLDSPYGVVPPNGFLHQLPPHLQQQQQQHQPPQPAPYRNTPPQFVDSRHASPVYYPQFYAPDNSFPLMHTPGVTPPPIHFPNNQPAAFFVPPRQNKIEIKAPGPDYSPALSKTAASSTTGEGARGASPAAPFVKPNFGLSMGGLERDGRMGGGQVPYGYQPSGEYIDSNGMVYFSPQQQQQQQQQQYAYPQQSLHQQQLSHLHQQQSQDPYYYQSQQNFRQQQQYSDPSILSMGHQHQQHHQQQQQRTPYGYPNRYE